MLRANIMPRYPTSFAALSSRLGSEQALRELRWLRLAFPNTPLGPLLARRSLGEPLQYIIGLSYSEPAT